ncbi:MAG: hypothetical protein C3F15_13945 [Holophagae bacterium]|nr:MAG: hypothetical protein C3F15_13945 [Holophagae bacterium]
MGTEPQRIIFLSQDPDSRANVGCQNGGTQPVTVNLKFFNSEGESREAKIISMLRHPQPGPGLG